MSNFNEQKLTDINYHKLIKLELLSKFKILVPSKVGTLIGR